jgi:ureidoacrylate peracid hydrolase
MANHCSHGINSRVVSLDARPDPIAIDPARTAVIVVDMQNDFGAKGGLFDRAGIDIAGIQKVIAPTAQALASARKAGVKIIYLKTLNLSPFVEGQSDQNT